MSEILEEITENIEETFPETTVENTENKGSAKASKKKDKVKKEKIKKDRIYRTGMLKFLQHCFATVAAVCLIVIITGSTIIVPSFHGNRSISLSTSDEGRKYEDSVLFNTILGNELSDMLRLVTIKSQVETNGVYDSQKVIDIVAYNNRANVNSSVNTPSAEYRLGDLIKWSKYGMDFEDVTRESLSEAGKNLSTNSSDGYLDYLEPDVTYSMLVNRYKSVEGKGLEAYASSWAEYGKLIDELEVASDDLYTNYSEYLKLLDYFDPINSNIRYYITMEEDRKQVVYTNIEDKDITPKNVVSVFKEYGKYISYDRDSMVYNTNTAITEATFNSLLSKYEYAYPDKCNIYIAVDMKTPAVDSISIGAKGFNNYLPYYSELYVIIALCAVFYMFILVVCTIREGKVLTSNGEYSIKLTGFDNTPLALWLLIVCGLIFAVGVAFGEINSTINVNLNTLSTLNARIIMGMVVFVCDVIVLTLYYSLIRRIKAHNIWKQGLIRKMIIKGAWAFTYIYDNSKLLIRSFGPIALLACVNIVLAVIIYREDDPFGSFLMFVLLCAINGAFAYFVYRQLRDRANIISGMKKIVAGDLSYKANSENLHGDNIE